MAKPKELPPEQGRLFTPQLEVPSFEDGISVNVEKRAKSLKKAATSLGHVAQYDALPKAMHVAQARRKLQKRYNTEEEPTALEEAVLPGAEVNRSEEARAARQEFDEAYGDLQAAKEAAWRQFTPAERAELELEMPDQEMEWVDFRHRMTNTSKSTQRQDGSPRRGKTKNFPTQGELARQKLHSRMDKTLQRFDESEPGQKAA